jgi:phosphopantothenoylcysteine synthetase/decarboxylase
MRVLLGVTGGIAAYKAADLVSKLVSGGHEVRVVMTRSATQFVTPLTFEALSGQPVMVDALATGATGDGPSSIQHISWAKWAEVACVAPLTANTLGKLAMGLADDALTTVWMALPPGIPNILCPAMNTQMWDHPIVQRNLAWLEDTRRYTLIAPVSKRLACGDVGVGGLAEVPDILAAILQSRTQNLQPAPGAGG